MSRTIATIANGARVMVDANILVYALNPLAQHHAVCGELLRRSARGDVSLFATVSIVSDVLHRVMVLEVIALQLAPRAADARALLKQQPQRVTQLTRYRTVLRDLRQAGVDRDLHASRQAREQHGLLANDSLIVAVMERERITTLATNDPDFERIGGVVVRTPAP